MKNNKIENRAHHQKSADRRSGPNQNIPGERRES
jgi:hypothetical protein